MTIQQQNSKAVYIADGNTKNFAIPFYFFNNDIAVYLNNDTTPLTISEDYTIQKESNNLIGEVVFKIPPKTGEKIIILRDVPLTQLVTFIEGESFPASDYERSLDKIVMTLQMLKETLSRTIQINPSTDITSSKLEELFITLNNELDTIKQVPILAQKVDDVYKEIINQSSQKIGPITVNTSEIIKSDIYSSYPYHLDITILDARSSNVPTIVLSLEDATSGIFAPIAESFDGYVRIFLKSLPSTETINIPIILLQ